MNDKTELAKTLIVIEFAIILCFGMVDVLTGITWDGYAMIHPDNLINEATALQALLSAGLAFLLIRDGGTKDFQRGFLIVATAYFLLFALNSQLEIRNLIDPLLPPLPHHLLNTMFAWSWTNLILALAITLIVGTLAVRNPFPEIKRRHFLYGAVWQFVAFAVFLLRPNAADDPQPYTLFAYMKETAELLSAFFYFLFFLLLFLAHRKSSQKTKAI